MVKIRKQIYRVRTDKMSRSEQQIWMILSRKRYKPKELWFEKNTFRHKRTLCKLHVIRLVIIIDILNKNKQD